MSLSPALLPDRPLAAAAAAARSRWRSFAPVLALVALTCAVYAPSLHNEFVWDDHPQIVGNRFLRSWSSVPRFFATDLAEGYGVPDEPVHFYRPLWLMSELVDYQLWGLWPYGFHLTNLLFHLTNGLLFYALLRRLDISRLAATLAAAVFLVHPAHPETTTFIAGRVALMSTCFQLAALLAVLAWTRDRRPLQLVGAAGGFGAALLSKEIAVTWPAVVLAAVACFPDRFRLRRRDWHSLAAAIGLVLAGYFVLRTLALSASTYPAVWSWPQRVVLALRALAAYLALAVAPLNLYPEKTVVLPGWPGIALAGAGLVAAAGLVAGARWSWRQDRRITFGVALFAIGFSLTSNLVPVTPTFADRWLYWPLTGLLLAAAAAGDGAGASWPAARRWLVGAGLAFVVTFSLLTLRENRVWHDDITLYETTIRRGGDSSRMRTALALSYLDRGEYDRARQHLTRALALSPRDDTALWAMGAADAAQGNDAAATNWLARAWAAQPRSATAALELAAAEERLGLTTAAEQTLRTIAARSRDPLAQVKLANFLIRHRRLDEAVRILQALLTTDEHYALAHNSLGSVWSQRGQPAAAAREFQLAVANDPKLWLAHANLGVLYAQSGNWPLARRHFQQALALEPSDPDLRAAYANALRHRDDPSAAPPRSSPPAP